MDKATAVESALRHLYREYVPPSGDEWVVVEESAIPCKLGWLFTYNTRSFIDTGDTAKAIFVGTGPLLIRWDNGEGWFFPPSYNIETLSKMIDANDPELKRWLPEDLV